MRKTSGILAMALMLGAMSGMSMDIPRTSTSRQLSFRERTLRWFLGLSAEEQKAFVEMPMGRMTIEGVLEPLNDFIERNEKKNIVHHFIKNNPDHPELKFKSL